MENSLRISSSVLEAKRRFKRWDRRKNGRRPAGYATVRSAVLLAARTICGNTQSLPKRSSFLRLRFNVGGATYEIAKRNLDKFPDTLLGSGGRERFFDATRNEYFLDRDPILFKGIVEYYRTGNFHICSTECPEETLDELSFYRIPIEQVQECCCGNIDFEKIRDKETSEQHHHHPSGRTNYHNTTRERMWDFFTNEQSSPAATTFSYFFAIVVLLNLCAIIAETVPARQEKLNITSSRCKVQTITKYWRYGSIYSDTFFSLDSFCVAIFTFEYAARLFSAPKRWEFVRQISNIVDFVGILPYYISIIETVVHFNNDTLDLVLTALRSLRVLRVTKLARHSTQFQDLIRSIKGAARELGGLLFSFLALIMMLSTLTYFVENHPPQEGGTKFVNIPVTFWYCIVTMTTLGYGDMVPMSIPGKIIGAVCVLIGVVLLSLPIPIIEMKFKEHKSLRDSKKYYIQKKASSRPVINSWPTRPDVSSAETYL